MPTIPFFLTQLFQTWRAAAQERELLLLLLHKPGDHLLRDVGMTREDAESIVGLLGLGRGAVLLAPCTSLDYQPDSPLWIQSERDILKWHNQECGDVPMQL